MLDRLPMPHITATKPEEQIAQVRDYLFHFKEELEFILMNISVDNLSMELIDKLNSLGADIETSKTESEEQLQQMNAKQLTVSDVVNSTLFGMEVESRIPKVTEIVEQTLSNQEFEERLNTKVEKAIPTFTINFENGNLEYE